DEQVKQAIGSTEGFALVLAGAKAWLEQGLTLGLIGDRHPKGVPTA
ncbi:MAG: polyketide cyclase, partial [Mesorhizobium sp.]